MSNDNMIIWNPSGYLSNPLTADTKNVSIIDVMTVLSNTKRWNASIDYSVLAHSCDVCELIANKHLRIYGLLHDIGEALTGLGDVPTKIKEKCYVKTEIPGISQTNLENYEYYLRDEFCFRIGLHSVGLFQDGELLISDKACRDAEYNYFISNKIKPFELRCVGMTQEQVEAKFMKLFLENHPTHRIAGNQ